MPGAATSTIIGATTSATVEAAYRARTPRSAAFHEEAQQLLPGGVTRSVAYYAPYPLCMASGRGCHVTDLDGHDYLDHLNNFGSLIHGHAHPAVVAAVRDQLALGTDFGAYTTRWFSCSIEGFLHFFTDVAQVFSGYIGSQGNHTHHIVSIVLCYAITIGHFSDIANQRMLTILRSHRRKLLNVLNRSDLVLRYLHLDLVGNTSLSV